MLHLSDSWVWDLWLADDGERYHMFFLNAPRSLPSPDDRHFSARIGHAVSSDLRTWERVADALRPDDPPAFDDLATWTGSVVRGDDESWYLFYTGASRAEGGLVQRIGLATSADLLSWERAGPVLVTDGRWYETLDQSVWPDQAWRDPWVFRGPVGWHMLFTARANRGSPDNRGVIGHATSVDLHEWEAQPPLSASGQGFGQLEVPQVEIIEGRPMLFFSCLAPELATGKRPSSGGIWAASGDSLLGGWDIERAQRVTDESLYAGRVIRDRSGQWMMMAFHNVGPNCQFVGDISDPMPLSIGGDGRVQVCIEA